MQNDMRDRLTALLTTEIECNKDGYGDCSICPYEYADKECERHIAELTADYLIANGVILPPCKVGDTVYSIIAECNAPYNYCPYNGGYGTARCDKEPCKAYVKESKFDVSDLENIGKTVFLTRKEAEAKIKESETK